MTTHSILQKYTNRISSLRDDILGRSHREQVTGMLYALPYLATFVVFLLYPLIKGFYMSLYKWNLLTGNHEFIGLQNYAQMMNDPMFWIALKNTAYFVAVTVPLLVFVSLGLALGVNRGIKGQRILTTFFFVPYILPVSVASLAFLFMYGDNGVITATILEPLLGQNPLDSPIWAMPAIVVTTVWWKVGFFFAVLLAARQNVPERLYEAAKLDGAGTWRMFRDVTLPNMKNGILFVVITAFINQFQVFGQPFVMTKGGPVNSTSTIVYYLYNVGFSRHDFGFAAAVGYVLLIILIGISFINYKFIGTNDE